MKETPSYLTQSKRLRLRPSRDFNVTYYLRLRGFQSSQFSVGRKMSRCVLISSLSWCLEQCKENENSCNWMCQRGCFNLSWNDWFMLKPAPEWFQKLSWFVKRLWLFKLLVDNEMTNTHTATVLKQTVPNQTRKQQNCSEPHGNSGLRCMWCRETLKQGPLRASTTWPENAGKAVFPRIQQGLVLLANQMWVQYAHIMKKADVVSILVSCPMLQQEKGFTFWNGCVSTWGFGRYSWRIYWRHHRSIHQWRLTLRCFQRVSCVSSELDLYKAKRCEASASKADGVITHRKRIDVPNFQLQNICERKQA